jgi:phage terminase small subunit
MTRQCTPRLRRGSNSSRSSVETPASPLSERKRKFVDAFMASGNATQAATAAGYSKKTAKQQGSRLLTFVDVQQAIAARAQNDPAVWTRIERQQFWTEVARGEGHYAKASLKDRLRASELLGKSQADFIERHQVDAGASLVELLADIVGAQR